tara:strand:+ start:4218 stop:4373 length:156 start_codon:yes stop_codon:yes gene_type:complete
MKRTKFTESQIVKALRETEQGGSVGDISSMPPFGIVPFHPLIQPPWISYTV